MVRSPSNDWLVRLLGVAAVTLLCTLLLAGRAGAVSTLSNWDAAQQRQVVAAHLMSNVGRSFAGGSQLTPTQANSAMSALARRTPTLTGDAVATIARVTRGPVTVTGFDRMVVLQLGLGDVASHVQSVAVGVGLHPPSYFGTEAVARFLGLRYDHPSGTDQLELFPNSPITRAEAAWSFAQILKFSDWQVSYARQTLSGFALPAMSADQLTALRIAVSRIGYPYVWGGTTDDTSDGLAHGGFDCSGFVWRVYKVSGLSWGTKIRGRTAAQQAGEIPRSQRLKMTQLKPGDLLFFGTAGFTSRATEANIYHEGIYLGDNWVIHSSGQGVYIEPLKGSWLGDEFAWGRRVIS
jgi:cell wall-associated NlpC family hydrolase